MAKLSRDHSEIILMFIWKKERKKEKDFHSASSQVHIKLLKNTFICY